MMAVQPGRLLSLSKPIARQILLMSLVQHSVKLMNSLKVHRFKLLHQILLYHCKLSNVCKGNLDVRIFIQIHENHPTTKLTTDIDRKVHGHFLQQIMGGVYLIVLRKLSRSRQVTYDISHLLKNLEYVLSW